MRLDRKARLLSWAAFSLLDRQGSIHAEQFLDEVRIRYVSAKFTADERDATYVTLCWYESVKEMWLGDLNVARPFRGLGLAKRLVVATERLAWRLGARSIYLFPLQRSREFWLAAGFEPYSKMSQVLTKTRPRLGDS